MSPAGDRRRSRAKKRASPGPSGGGCRFLALHENKLVLCLAGGLVSPQPRGAALVDQHVLAGRLVLGVARPGPEELRAARGPLEYGNVVILEVDLALIPGSPADAASVSTLPLAAVKCVIFPSREALEEFSARLSGYGDVVPGLVPFIVDAESFQAGRESNELVATAQLPLVPVPTPAGDDTTQEPTPAGAHREQFIIDVTAGSLAAACHALSLSGQPELIANLVGLMDQLPAGPDICRVPESLAALLDAGDDAGQTSQVLAEVVRIIVEKPLEDSVDASDVLARVDAALRTGTSPPPEVALKFLRHAGEIVGLRRDLPRGAFTDNEGSVTLRAILLFLLNPDPDRIGALMSRTEDLGPRVLCLAAALMGLSSGFASLGREVKGPRARALAVPQLAFEAFLGEAPEAVLDVAWDARDGSSTTRLSWRDSELCSSGQAPVPELQAVSELARDGGHAVSYDPVSGDLLVEPVGGHPCSKVSVRRTGGLPVFVEGDGVEMCLDHGAKLGKRALAKLVSEVNSASVGTAVFAGEAQLGKEATLRLRVFLVSPFGAEAFSAALTALGHARDFCVGRSPSPKPDKK